MFFQNPIQFLQEKRTCQFLLEPFRQWKRKKFLSFFHLKLLHFKARRTNSS